MAEYKSKIDELQKELSKTKYNKRTQHHIGLVKAKIAKLKEREESRGSKKGAAHGYSVRKTGDGTVLLLGFPSVGKSTLLNGITDAESETGAYAFTTLTCIPGILEYNHAKIQVLDVPGVVKGAATGRGRGKEVLAVMRSADLALIVIDANFPDHYNVLMQEVYDSGIRLNQRPPDIKIKRTAKDGIKIGKTVRCTHLNDETIKGILKEFRINNADVVIRSNITDDQLIDAIEANKSYIPGVTIVNKIDTVSKEDLNKVMKKVKADIGISAVKKKHLEDLKELIFERLNLIRIYMKEPSKPADMEIPMIMKKNCTIRDLCEKVHREFVDKFKFARVWGKSAKFDGQKLMLKHVLKDEDVVELHLR